MIKTVQNLKEDLSFVYKIPNFCNDSDPKSEEEKSECGKRYRAVSRISKYHFK